jgi:hypothetical protein
LNLTDKRLRLFQRDVDGRRGRSRAELCETDEKFFGDWMHH